jgi:hypothetical protein
MITKMYSNHDGRKKNGKSFLVASILLGAGLLSATILGAQFFSPQAAAQENNTSNGTTISQVEGDSRPTVMTSGSATIKVEPDKVSITVGVETNGTTAQEAASKNANVSSDVLDALTAMGIPEEQISTSQYNVFPRYDSRQPPDACITIYPPPPGCEPGQEITGYVASSSLTVTLDVNGTIDGGEVIDTAIEAGANTVNGVFFFISTERQEEIRDGLIGDAIENARHRADVAATAVGMAVSGVKAINLNDVYFPVFSTSFDASLRAEAAQTQLLPGEQEVTMTVTVAYYIS